ncbi:NAD(P)/FAD-dependent oxidoreductase [Virgibacillus sp. AGTR]|uniref:NAD(P)/FAD-dependent oxidoreductase n=1 Tax=Virgibacillus sp. AGTR TaxID=2812055 RepID=UPI0019633995|nr:NAD(P)/FAD-dependent oxidoreductase [Virgibacillus sp. AGTR]MCC2251484.1 NAD(P)/FAD-dependent oxidoreductase [Virgibacillus sp. AGTR]QRZ19883.1 NAD(P)/FAD-dependent oxidoreductase [Virgibacillus sp. AGTR]
MLLDCIVIGGGPAGLNASLMLGRSKRKTILFDDNKPRNAVTNESHGFITRDGIHPLEFKQIAREELSKYPNVIIKKQRVLQVDKYKQVFTIKADDGEVYKAKKIILATGLKETLPNIAQVNQFYGTSIFSCPFCDGWELRDRPLALIAENNRAFHMAKVVFNWSKDLIVCTNGKQILSVEQKNQLNSKGIIIYEQEITSLQGDHGYLKGITFAGGESITREGGFVTPEWEQASSIGRDLDCEFNDQGGIKVDRFGRTNVEGVYASGDTLLAGATQLIIAAAEGSKAALGVNAALMEEDF